MPYPPQFLRLLPIYNGKVCTQCINKLKSHTLAQIIFPKPVSKYTSNSLDFHSLKQSKLKKCTKIYWNCDILVICTSTLCALITSKVLLKSMQQFHILLTLLFIAIFKMCFMKSELPVEMHIYKLCH